ncbi:MAG TPA: efflux RND transporter periplasmic adaptor subunit [Vicinamibacterales bacterium]|jgi:HlyD family secretion protein|nr:efflux RND transporter periplasmic adaptor subunit [Vicinamibacterales bacterium]
MTTKRSSFWRVLIGLVIISAVGAVFFFRAKPATTAPELQFETVKADRGPIVAKVTASGTLSALVTVQVGSQVSGRVQAIFVDYNSPVTAGEVIAKLDPLLFQAAVDQSAANYLTAQSALKSAQAQEANAQLQYERSKSLLERKLVAPSDFDTAKATYDAAVAQVDGGTSGVALALASLNQAKVNLGYATIVSPIDGTVVSRSVDVGQTVASAFQAPVLFVIARDLRKMQVDTSVSEADVGKLQAGMPATFTVDAFPDDPFTGTVRQVRNAATTVQNVVTYDAVLDVDNPALKLKPGMTANVSLVVARKDDAVRVPNAAVRFQPDAALLRGLGITPPAPNETLTRKWLWTLHEGRPVAVQVDTGISDGTLTDVAGGVVQAGDTLITDMSEVPKKRFGLF